MYKNIITLLAILTFGVIPNMLISSAFAQKVDINALTPVKKIIVTSKQLAAGMAFNVTLPIGYEANSDESYIVMLDFHPRSQPYLSGMHDWLSHNGQWPWLKTLIVTPVENSEAFVKVFESMDNDSKGKPLLDFLEHDLMATIDKNFRTNGYRIINGFRGNGTLGLFTLFNRPDLFNAYIIASPNLADDYAKLMTDAAGALAKLNDKPRFLYLSSGDHRFEKADLPSFEKLAKILAANAPKELDWQAVNQDEHYFMAQPVISALKGIEAIFHDYHTSLQPDSDIAKKGPQALVDYYKYLSEQKYGFTVSAENSLTALGNSLLEKNVKEAMKVFEVLVKEYPDSSWAIYALANAHAKTGNVELAIELQTSAVKKAASLGDWHVKKHKSHLETFRAKLMKKG